MKTRYLAVAGVGIVLGALAAVAVYSGEAAPPSGEFRKQFIKDFRRTGLNTTPEDAMTLRILIEASKAKRGVEVGSATGFGAINMGIGFERNGGRLDTIDIDPKMVTACRENVRQMGLEKVVTVIEGDALKVLPTIEGDVDFVFIDALKQDYGKYFKLISPRLKPGAVVVADNAIQSASAMKDFLDFMRTSPEWEMVIVQASKEKNDGMAICYKVR
jgi:predicted O-methyltransferase YrrM